MKKNAQNSNDLSACVCFNFRKTARAVTQLYDGIMKPSGLQGTQFSLIAVISALESSTINRLSEALVMDRTTLTRNLKVLEKQGLVRITPGEDQRTRVVTISGKGSKRFNDALPLWEKAQSHMVDRFGKKRWMDMMADLKKVVSMTRAG